MRQGKWTTSRDDRRSARHSGPLGGRDTPDLELVHRFRWNPTQVVVIAAGIFLMALGGIGLARAGAEGITGATSPEVVIGGWRRTPLMAAIESASAPSRTAVSFDHRDRTATTWQPIPGV
jgi:hypothetical protein